jgi:acetoin utilization deacetylase AcuC-like enzyme/GNAT superfamily N-acetyltransferase
MFRIRRIFDDVLDRNRQALDQVRTILASQFRGLSQAKVDRIPDILRNPFKYDFRSIVYVAEGRAETVQGFALLSHEPRLGFCYLDFMATRKRVTGRGVGGALYGRVREEARLLHVMGIFFECLPDDPALCRDPEILKQNKARLRFYETFGARPIENTAYETPVQQGGDSPPYLMFDDLGQHTLLPRNSARKVVKTILERKYRGICSPEYVNTVVESFRDNPVRLCEPRYIRALAQKFNPVSDRLSRIALVVSDRHSLHHVHSRGYVESPVRIQSILGVLEQTSLFDPVVPSEFPEKHILAVHDRAYLNYFKRVCEKLGPDSSVYPYVFPIRNQSRPPTELAVRAGYYCIDTFTPLNRRAFIAAKRAADCALTAATKILEGNRLAYALVRPPGHHAEARSFGGFCYFNNAAIAAQYLSEYGSIAMLDIDYHHGNGQQTIFYRRNDVLTVSIHGHPGIAYPYFSGFADERGEAHGFGYNVNFPLLENLDGEGYMRVMEKALSNIRRFSSRFLIVCLGLDTAKGDPTGTWSLLRKDFAEMGKRIGGLGLPILVIQEGGYNNRSIGKNARAFFEGLWNAVFPHG